MKSSKELEQELKHYRRYANKKIKSLKERIKKAIQFEETHPTDELLEQEAEMRDKLASYKPPKWKVGNSGYVVFHLGSLTCPKLTIKSIYKDKYTGKQACFCGPYGPGVPRILLSEMFSDPLVAIASFYFDFKESDRQELGFCWGVPKTTILKLAREWYFETQEKETKNRSSK